MGTDAVRPSRELEQTQSANVRDLASSRLLARNVGVNLIGWVLPAGVALFAVPGLTRGYGAERFGLLSLAWSLVGYFTLLDLGLGRAVTQLVAARFGRVSDAELAGVAWTALGLLAVIAPLTSLPLVLGADTLALQAVRSSTAVRPDVATAVRALAFAVPMAVLTSGMRGLLEAVQAFPIINALRIPIGVLTYAGPLVVLPFAPPDRILTWAVVALAAGRAVVAVAHAWAIRRVVPWIRTAPRWSARDARALLTMGGWLSVSNLLAPVLTTVDRVALTNASTAAATGYYAAAQEVATKMWLFTGALFPVVFPAIALVWSSDPRRAAALIDRATRLVLVCLLPVTLACVIAAPDLLTVWLGSAFASRSAPSLQVLAVALYVNCVGQGAYTAVQAAGRPAITAASHAVQVVPFAAALWWAAPRYGAVGVAVVVAIRLAVDAAIVVVALGRLLPPARPALWRTMSYLGAAGAVLVALLIGSRTGLLSRPAVRLEAFALLVAAHVAFTARWLVLPDEIATVIEALRARRVARRERMATS